MILGEYILYQHAWVSRRAPHLSSYLSNEECKTLLKKGGFLIRNDFNFDKKENTHFWYIIKDSFDGMSELPSKSRNQIKRALNTLDIKIISKEQLIEDGWPVHKSAIGSYKIKSGNASEEAFINRVKSCGKSYEFWGCFLKDSKIMVAYAINYLYDGQCEYETFKGHRDYLRGYYPLYGLIYEMNQYYLKEKKLLYVLDGARSVTNHSNIQPFLENKFNFRRAYCDLNIKYVWWLNIAIKMAFPFRRFLPLSKIKGVLNMEAMRRGLL